MDWAKKTEQKGPIPRHGQRHQPAGQKIRQNPAEVTGQKITNHRKTRRKRHNPPRKKTGQKIGKRDPKLGKTTKNCPVFVSRRVGGFARSFLQVLCRLLCLFSPFCPRRFGLLPGGLVLLPGHFLPGFLPVGWCFCPVIFARWGWCQSFLPGLFPNGLLLLPFHFCSVLPAHFAW